MTASEKNMLALVRGALWDTPINIEGTPNWVLIIKSASQQTLLGLVASSIERLPNEKRPNKALISRLQATLFRIISSHNLLCCRLSEIVTILNTNQIDHVLLKGEGVALNYPDPAIRQCGDIDLYIGPDKCQQALHSLLEAYGMEKHTHENAKHYHINIKGVIVELHKMAETVPGAFANKRYQKWSTTQLSGPGVRRVQIAGNNVTLPPHNFDAIYILNHIWHHFVTGGIGLRQICDWVLYLHKFHKEIDLRQLESDLKSFGLWNVWQIFGKLAVCHLGLPENELPLYTGTCNKKADDLLEVILMEGNFGKHSKNRDIPPPKGYVAGKLHSFKINARRLFCIISISPTDVIKAWIAYFINGIINFVKFKERHENN